MEYFKRSKYQEKFITEKYFKLFLESFPQYAKLIDYQKFKRYWKYIRLSMYEAVLENPSGVELPLFFGNISIKVLDREFLEKKDLMVDKRKRFPGVENPNKIFSGGNIKKASITWKKNKIHSAFVQLMAFEKAITFRRTIGKRLFVQGIKKYEKLNQKEVPRIKVEEKPFSIFDLAE